MSGYRLIIGIMIIVTMVFLWIVFNETVVEARDRFNNMTGDVDIITRNNMASSIFYYALFYLIIMVVLWVLRSTLEDRRPKIRGLR